MRISELLKSFLSYSGIYLSEILLKNGNHKQFKDSLKGGAWDQPSKQSIFVKRGWLLMSRDQYTV